MFNKFIQRPVLSIVISLIVFLGVLSVMNTYYPFPSISPPMVNVTADYPGSNGELMIKSVIIPLERALNGVPV
jgi:HAE1 family hydrophobic/amphiphilic exporter-1